MTSIVKTSIIIITYNQEKLISRAINSVLKQKKWIYELIICDDCSTDSNWDIIQNYLIEQEGFIRAYRNSHNLGIFENYESTWSKPKGDLVSYLAGDDEFCENYFENAYNFINTNNLNISDKNVILSPNYKIIYPNGKGKIIKNRTDFHNNFLSAKLRGLITERGCIFSTGILKKCNNIPKGQGIYTDFLQDIQKYIYADQLYYLDITGSNYYCGIGIASKTSKKDSIKSMLAVMTSFEKWPIVKERFTDKDLHYIKFLISRSSLYLKFSIKLSFATICHGIKSIDSNFGLKGLKRLIW